MLPSPAGMVGMGMAFLEGGRVTEGGEGFTEVRTFSEREYSLEDRSLAEGVIGADEGVLLEMMLPSPAGMVGMGVAFLEGGRETEGGA